LTSYLNMKVSNIANPKNLGFNTRITLHQFAP